MRYVDGSRAGIPVSELKEIATALASVETQMSALKQRLQMLLERAEGAPLDDRLAAKASARLDQIEPIIQSYTPSGIAAEAVAGARLDDEREHPAELMTAVSQMRQPYTPYSDANGNVADLAEPVQALPVDVPATEPAGSVVADNELATIETPQQGASAPEIETGINDDHHADDCDDAASHCFDEAETESESDRERADCALSAGVPAVASAENSAADDAVKMDEEPSATDIQTDPVMARVSTNRSDQDGDAAGDDDVSGQACDQLDTDETVAFADGADNPLPDPVETFPDVAIESPFTRSEIVLPAEPDKTCLQDVPNDAAGRVDEANDAQTDITDHDRHGSDQAGMNDVTAGTALTVLTREAAPSPDDASIRRGGGIARALLTVATAGSVAVAAIVAAQYPDYLQPLAGWLGRVMTG